MSQYCPKQSTEKATEPSHSKHFERPGRIYHLLAYALAALTRTMISLITSAAWGTRPLVTSTILLRNAALVASVSQ